MKTLPALTSIVWPQPLRPQKATMHCAGSAGSLTTRRCEQVLCWTPGASSSYYSPVVGLNRKWSGFVCNVASQEASVSSLMPQEVVFTWNGGGTEVLVSADYLKWEARLPLQKGANGSFSIKQKLVPGKYQIKFIVDGTWRSSPALPTVFDERGIMNNEITVVACQIQAAGDVSDAVLTDTKVEPYPAAVPAAAPAPATAGPSSASTLAPVSASAPVDAPAPVSASAPVDATAPAAASVPGATSPAAPPVPAPGPGIDPAPKSVAQPTSVQPSPASWSAPPGPAPEGPQPKAGVGKAVAKKGVAKLLPASMTEDIIPALRKVLEAEEDVIDVQLVFQDNQLQGNFVKNRVPYAFWALFADGTFEGSRGFAFASYGNNPSTVEPFLVDEKKITPDLVVFWVKKRLFAQRILSVN